jgi:hypothetical protein
VASRDSGHALVGLHPKNANVPGREQPRRDTGPTADVEHITGTTAHQLIDKGPWVAGTSPVVQLSVDAEGTRTITIAIEHSPSCPATNPCIAEPDPGPG